MTAFSIQEELRRLTPIDLEAETEENASAPPVPYAVWEAVARNMAKLGKHQLRATQHVEDIAQQTQVAITEARLAAEAAREDAEDRRREVLRLRESAQNTALRVVGFLDSLDDVHVLARQRGDSQWLKYVDRLTHDAMVMLQSIGITEIPAAGRMFDPEEHEALDTVEPSGTRRQFEIVEIVQRGFRLDGRVLRRAQVITVR